MATNKFKLTNSNSRVIFIDKSERTSAEFKNKLMKLMIKILESEEVTFHLKDINICFDDSKIRPSSLEKIYRRGKIPPRLAYDDNRKSIIINADEWFLFYNFQGTVPFYRHLKPTLTHELIHYLHHSINKNLRKIWNANFRLMDKYERDYKEFKNLLTLGSFSGNILTFLNLFIEKCITEGFAKFFEEFKHENITFTQESFQYITKKLSNQLLF